MSDIFIKILNKTIFSFTKCKQIFFRDKASLLRIQNLHDEFVLVQVY